MSLEQVKGELDEPVPNLLDDSDLFVDSVLMCF